MKVGFYFARVTVGWFALLALVGGMLAFACATALPTPRVGWPVPWSFAGPLFAGAALVVWRRAQRSGELVALAAAGTSRRSVVLPMVLLGGVLHVLFALPEGAMPATPVREVAVHRSVVGDLFASHRGRGVWLRADGRLELADATLPDSFRSAPQNPRRYRRQAFVLRAPRLWRQDPYDPWLWRWLYGGLFTLIPSLLMTTRRASLWGLGAIPLLIVVAL